MRIAVIFLFLASSVSFAEQIATTEDGKKVVLKDDGTWAYVGEAKTVKKETGDEYANSIAVIKEKCKTDWPADFQMRAYCEKQQNEAVLKLKEGKPNDINIEEYEIVHKKCVTEWSQDYQMRAYCEKQQFEALRELRK